MADKIFVMTNSSTGLYNFRNELLSALCRQAEVLVSVPAGDKCELLEQIGCKIIPTELQRRSINPVTDFGLICRYWKLLKKEKPHMVVTYTIKPNIYGGLVCRLRKIPYAVNITGLGTTFQKRNVLRGLVTFLYKTALKKAKVIFFENSANMRLFLDEKIAAPEQCCLLSGAGVNLEHFAYTPYPRGEQVRFLFVGRVMKEKGIDELFAAMERLYADGENVCLDVLGSYEENYAEIIRRHEGQGWLRYRGYQSDVRPFIANAHCFVLPSYHEGMANTNLECASMGRPLITSDIPGCREAVIERKSGLLCKPQDADNLYAAMKCFLSMSEAERAQMGLAGRAHMEAAFDKRKVVAATVEKLSNWMG